LKIAYSFGIIDLLHFGHIRALSEAKKNADLHFFGLLSDESSKDWMGDIVSSFDERHEVLSQIKSIDLVIPQFTLDPTENLKTILVDYPDAEITIFHGDNWENMLTEDFIKSIGGKIVFTKYYSKLTPENILATLKSKSLNKPFTNKLISTKANTLSSLKSKIKYSFIEDILIIQVHEYLDNPQESFEKIKSAFKGRMIVVRSSTSNEDGLSKSNAGHYCSVLNINPNNNLEVSEAILSVIESYRQDLSKIDEEQILIQPQTENVKFGGVVFTRDIHENRPYYLINYDDTSTDSVTSGSGGKILWISKTAKNLPTEWENLIRAVGEIESLLSGMILDIEFAIKNSGEVIIFQVRPLAANYRFKKDTNDEEFELVIRNAISQYELISRSDDKSMMFSDMAFWNPSEIIGSNPRNLDYSLYREVITKSAWNKGLVKIGYNEVSNELMYRIGNKPYISLDYSFKSLIPAGLSSNLTQRLVNFYKKKLENNLVAHDKIEFEIIHNCFNLTTSQKLKELTKHNFTEEEIYTYEASLFYLTHNAIKEYPSHLDADLSELEILIQILNESSAKVLKGNISFNEKIDLLKSLVETINNSGTTQFSRQARFAFISRSLLQSMIDKDIIDNDSFDRFMGSIGSIASKIENDFHMLSKGKLSNEEFLKHHGHLRSNTYDIRSLTYLESDLLFAGETKVNERKNLDSNSFFNQSAISNVIKKLGFDIGTSQFLDFLRNSIIQREFFKYEFTKVLSYCIDLIVDLGRTIGIERNDLSYLEIPDIYAARLYPNLHEVKLFWETIIRGRRDNYYKYSKLVLPEVITKGDDLENVFFSISRPNFITSKNIQGELVFLEESKSDTIGGKIVVITKADPGFDWIFSKGIKGLITKYGGVASHMAIRCAEFDIPAAIGCGEIIFNNILEKKEVQLDCKNGKIY